MTVARWIALTRASYSFFRSSSFHSIRACARRRSTYFFVSPPRRCSKTFCMMVWCTWSNRSRQVLNSARFSDWPMKGMPALFAAAIFAVATAVQVVLGRLSPGQALGIGLPVLIGGLALVEGGLRTEALGVFLAGTAASGIGVGLSFMASTAIVNRIAPPRRRAELMAAYFASGYCGQTIPVVAIGATSGWIGTADATLGCAIATAALAAATLLVASGMRKAGAPGVA